MSKFTKVLYSTKLTDILETRNDTSGSYLIVTNDLSKCTKKADGSWDLSVEPCKSTLKLIGFKIDATTSQVQTQIMDEIYTPSNTVVILPASKVTVDSTNNSIYEFNLYLKVTKKRGNQNIEKTLNFNNKIQPITFK